MIWWIAILIFQLQTWALNYEGTLLDSSQEPIAKSGVKLKFEIFDDGVSCILYEREYTLDLSETDGHFLVDLASGSGPIGQPHETNSLEDVLSNHNGNSVTCANNSNRGFSGMFVKRQVRMSVLEVEGVDIEDIVLPLQDLDELPYARHSRYVSNLYNEQIQTGHIADSAITDEKLASGIDAAKLTGTLPALDGSALTDLTASSLANDSISIDKLDFASSDGVNIPQLAGNPTSPNTGQIYYNTTTQSMMVYNGADWDMVGSAAGNGTVGLVGAFPTDTCPAGWLITDGSAVSRNLFPDLFAAIGVMYGPGDGSTTFELPDYRGQFLRGVDGGAGNDPDAATRAVRGDGTAGDNVGTLQSGQMQAHSHDVDPPSTSTSTNGSHTHGYTDASISDAAGTALAPDSPNELLHVTHNRTTAASGNHSHTVNIPMFASGTVGGNETRPINISVTYCISYSGGVASGSFAADGTTPLTGNIRLNGQFLSNDGDEEGLFVDTDGNVGIGTMSPDESLTVDGVIHSLSGGIKFPDGNTATSAPYQDCQIETTGGNAAANEWMSTTSHTCSGSYPHLITGGCNNHGNSLLLRGSYLSATNTWTCRFQNEVAGSRSYVVTAKCCK